MTRINFPDRSNHQKPEKPKGRKPLRRVSKKRAALNRSVQKRRADFRKEFSRCCWCGESRLRDHTIDEIVRGSSRGVALGDRRAWLPACYTCNSFILTGIAIEQKLAIKLCIDPAYFDLEAINKMRGRSGHAITLADVSAWLKPVAHSGECLDNYNSGKPLER